MPSVANMIAKCEGLLGTKDVNEFESQFLASVVERHRAGRELSEKQLGVLQRIHDKHFAR